MMDEGSSSSDTDSDKEQRHASAGKAEQQQKAAAVAPSSTTGQLDGESGSSSEDEQGERSSSRAKRRTSDSRPPDLEVDQQSNKKRKSRRRQGDESIEDTEDAIGDVAASSSTALSVTIAAEGHENPGLATLAAACIGDSADNLEEEEDDDRKPAAIATKAGASQSAGLGGQHPADNWQINTTSRAAIAPSVASARQDPEGVRIVKEIVAQRKQQESEDTDPLLMDGWFNWLDDLLEYYEKHGHCQVRDAENHILYSWLKRQRIMYRKGKLEPDKLRILQLLKTNGFEMPKAKETGSGTARGSPAAAQAEDATRGKQAAAKPPAAQAALPTGQGQLPQATHTPPVAVANPIVGGNPPNPLPPPLAVQESLAGTATLLSQAMANQSLTVAGFPGLLASLQASSAANQPTAPQGFGTSRQQRQDPPARIAGAPQEETTRGTQNTAAVASLLASAPSDSPTSALASLVDIILGRQMPNLAQPNPYTTLLGRQLPNLAQPNPQPNEPRITNLYDSTRALVVLLQQRQEQQRQQQQQQQEQQLLEQLLRELQRRLQDDERPN